MPLVAVVVGSIGGICREFPATPGMRIFGCTESRTGCVELVLAAEAVEHARSGIFVLRPELHVQPLVAGLDVDVRQLQVAIVQRHLLFLGRSRCIIAVGARVLGGGVEIEIVALKLNRSGGVDEAVHTCSKAETGCQRSKV